MNDAGYTLAEALAALVMIALAVGGLTEATGMLQKGHAHLEASNAATGGLARARQLLHELPEDLGPFRIVGGKLNLPLEGDRDHASFACGGYQDCGVSIARGRSGSTLAIATADHRRSIDLPSLSALQLAYVSALDGVTFPNWPDGRNDDRLSAIMLFNGVTPIAEVRIRAAQPGACAFDLMRGDCLAPIGETPLGSPVH